MRDEDTLAPGTRFGVYEVVRLLGRGGMGAVYQARHTTLEKVVALKVLAREYAASAEACERFVREGKAASRIRHPHIVDVSDLGVSHDRPFLVMEYLDGEDLSHLLEREHRLSSTRLAELMLPVLSAVQAAHDHQIVHRDLKPENIFLARTSLEVADPKVLDFGIAKLGGTDKKGLTNTDAVMGTAYYMSPEQVRGAANVGPASDQFALGVILYECAVGTRPFDAANVLGIIHAIATGAFVPPRVASPDIAPDLEALILHAMAPRPEGRFASVRDLGRALFAFADDDTRVRWARTYGEPSGRHSAPSAPRPSGALAPAPAQAPPIEPGRDTFAVARTAPAITLDPPRAYGQETAPNTPALASPPSAGTFGPVSFPAPPKAPTPKGPIALVAVLAIAVLIAGALALSGRHGTRGGVVVTAVPSAAAPEIIHLDAVPETADFTLDGRLLGRGVIDVALPVDGAAHTLVVSASGYEPRTFDIGHGRPPPRIELTALPQPLLAVPPSPSVASPSRPVAPAVPRARTRDAPAATAEPTRHAAGRPQTETYGANGALIVE